MKPNRNQINKAKAYDTAINFNDLFDFHLKQIYTQTNRKNNSIKEQLFLLDQLLWICLNLKSTKESFFCDHYKFRKNRVQMHKIDDFYHHYLPIVIFKKGLNGLCVLSIACAVQNTFIRLILQNDPTWPMQRQIRNPKIQVIINSILYFERSGFFLRTGMKNV